MYVAHRLKTVMPGLGYNKRVKTKGLYHVCTVTQESRSCYSEVVITLNREDREIKSGMYKLSSKLRVSMYKCILYIYYESESEYVVLELCSINVLGERKW